MRKDYGGIINELVSKSWKHPNTGAVVPIDIRSIVIKDSLYGMEGELIYSLHKDEKLGIVSDTFTHEVLGKRVAGAARSKGCSIEEIIWENPSSTREGVEELRRLTQQCDGLIAVGSGTINDSVKYATFQDKKRYSVFPTSPQSAYTTPTASISFDGFKKSLTTHTPQGVFYDLNVVSKCPIRLTRSAYTDMLCRTTSQVDWLLSHFLLGTEYNELPYILLAYDEDALFDGAAALKEGDTEAYGVLIRTCALMGLGTCFTATTHSGSMGEHMMSHYIDMFAGNAHPGSMHGEQIGITTPTMSRLQNQILSSPNPPVLSPTVVNTDEMIARYGEVIGEHCIKQLRTKAFDRKKTDELNLYLSQKWKSLSSKLREVMLPTERLLKSIEQLGAPRTSTELGLPLDFYQEAVLHSREIRDRYTMLDLAGDSGLLEEFARKEK